MKQETLENEKSRLKLNRDARFLSCYQGYSIYLTLFFFSVTSERIS